jgi:hypothetical protein
VSGRLRPAVRALLLLLVSRRARCSMLTGLKRRVLRRVGHLAAAASAERPGRGGQRGWAGRILSRSRRVAVRALTWAFGKPRRGRPLGIPARSRVVGEPALGGGLGVPALPVIPLRGGQLTEPALGGPGLIRRTVITLTRPEPPTALSWLGRHLGPGRSLAAMIRRGFGRPLPAGHRPVTGRRRGGGQVLRRALGSWGRWRQLGRQGGLRLNRGLWLRLSVGRTRRGGLGLRCRGRSLRHGLGSSRCLSLRGRLGLLRRERRGLLRTGCLRLPWILCLRGQGVGDGRGLGG